jgi:hypothetical protein
MMGLLGLLILADQRNASLLLPSWRTNYPKDPLISASTREVWGEIAWPEHFPPALTPPAPASTKSGVLVNDGWAALEKYRTHESFAQWEASFAVPLYTQILIPRPQLQAHVDRLIERYGTSYGALHARVELDMRAHPRFEQQVISLSEILAVMHNSTLEKVDVLFVAVGDAILPDDRETLERGVTPWGGRLVRRKDMGPTNLSYLDNSIIDMAICEHAQYFVGFLGSTFTEMVAFKRRHTRADGRSYYYNHGVIAAQGGTWIFA